MTTQSSLIALSEPRLGFRHWMERVLEEAKRAEEAFAADPVHDLRVALRRCRSMADGFRPMDPDPAWRAMKKAGGRVFRSLGDLRDVQVMRDWVQQLAPPEDPVAQVLDRSLADREDSLKREAQTTLGRLDHGQWRKWADHLAGRAARVPLGGAVFQYLALQHWYAARELQRLALRNRSQASWHTLRIGIKRLRYTIENFLPEHHVRWGKDLKQLQDLLGEIHDFDVLWGHIRAYQFENNVARDRTWRGQFIMLVCRRRRRTQRIPKRRGAHRRAGVYVCLDQSCHRARGRALGFNGLALRSRRSHRRIRFDRDDVVAHVDLLSQSTRSRSPRPR